MDGFALNCSRASQAMPVRVVQAKIAFLDFNLQKHKLQMGVQVVVTDTKQVEEIRQREMDITKEKIQRILSAGAKVCNSIIFIKYCFFSLTHKYAWLLIK